ncbi:hypothetical protein TNCV_596951, partial [Trichonephila clavipes]
RHNTGFFSVTVSSPLPPLSRVAGTIYRKIRLVEAGNHITCEEVNRGTSTFSSLIDTSYASNKGAAEKRARRLSCSDNPSPTKTKQRRCLQCPDESSSPGRWKRRSEIVLNSFFRPRTPREENIDASLPKNVVTLGVLMPDGNR